MTTLRSRVRFRTPCYYYFHQACMMNIAFNISQTDLKIDFALRVAFICFILFIFLFCLPVYLTVQLWVLTVFRFSYLILFYFT